MKSFVLSIIFYFLFGCLFSTSIQGNVYKTFVNKRVNLIEYTDYITYNYRVLQSTIVDSNRKFFFDIDLKETKQAIIQIEDLVGIIYLDPNQSYTIYFPPNSEDGVYKLSRNYVNILFDTLPKNDINALILQLNTQIDNFIYTNGKEIGTPTFKLALDTLKKEIKDTYKDISNGYFTTYAKYSIGNLDLITKTVDQNVSKLYNYKTYIESESIQTNNEQYISYISKFYDKILLYMSPNQEYFLLEPIAERDFVKLDTLLQKNAFLKRKDLRELVIISNLFSLYNDDRLEKADARYILEYMEKNSIYPPIANYAKNVLYQLTKLEKGSQAPNFRLINKDQEYVSLEDFKGKYVYIGFWATWSPESIGEMDLFEEFIRKYGNNITFVSINIDNSKSTFDTYLATNKVHSGYHLYYGGKTSVIEDYEVNNIPHYVFIDPDGKIIQSPAERPSSTRGNYVSIDKVFFDLNKTLSTNKRFVVGGK